MYPKNEKKIRNITSINIHTLMEDTDKKEKEDYSDQLDATIWFQTMMSESSWGHKCQNQTRKRILCNYRETQST